MLFAALWSSHLHAHLAFGIWLLALASLGCWLLAFGVWLWFHLAFACWFHLAFVGFNLRVGLVGGGTGDPHPLGIVGTTPAIGVSRFKQVSNR